MVFNFFIKWLTLFSYKLCNFHTSYNTKRIKRKLILLGTCKVLQKYFTAYIILNIISISVVVLPSDEGSYKNRSEMSSKILNAKLGRKLTSNADNQFTVRPFHGTNICISILVLRIVTNEPPNVL